MALTAHLLKGRVGLTEQFHSLLPVAGARQCRVAVGYDSVGQCCKAVFIIQDLRLNGKPIRGHAFACYRGFSGQCGTIVGIPCAQHAIVGRSLEQNEPRSPK
jgi:hypothetical protein